MAYGKAIELFLVNGTADSLITAELSNWNGKAIKIPRIEVAACNRNDIAQAGVYFLFCKEDDGSDSVYIGERKHCCMGRQIIRMGNRCGNRKSRMEIRSGYIHWMKLKKYFPIWVCVYATVMPTLPASRHPIMIFS